MSNRPILSLLFFFVCIICNTLRAKSDERPSAFQYALFSQLAYAEDLKEKEDLAQRNPTLENWKVYRIKNGERDYRGVLFKNPLKRQAVLAHKGTVSLKDWTENILGVVFNRPTSTQKEEAYKFTEDAVGYARDEDYQLSFTGHSLGGFLAELSVYFCHRNFEYPEVNAVTFESPGSSEALVKLNESAITKFDFNRLDIMTYLSYPNLVNGCNHHIGTVCHFKPSDVAERRWTGYEYTLSSHGIKRPVDYLNPASSETRKVEYMHAWPVSGQRDEFFEHAKWDDGKYALADRLDQSEEFKLIFAGGYQAYPYIPAAALPIRHFRPRLQDFLIKFFDMFWGMEQTDEGRLACKERWQSKHVSEALQAALSAFQIVGDRTLGGNDLFVVLAGDVPGIDMIEKFRQLLSKELDEHPEWIPVLLRSSQGKKSELTVKAVLIENGAEVLPGGKVKGKVTGARAIMVGKHDQESLEQFAEMQNNFWKQAKAHGVKITAIGVENGAKIEGEVDADVTATEFVFEPERKTEL